MTYVAVEGSRLFTRVDGGEKDNRPWLVLSNSVGADHSMWDPQVASLIRRYRVLRYDTRGHGRSDAPSGPYSFDMLVADVIAIMDYHDIGKTTFMGLSLGGMTGLGLALRHADRLEKFVCCDARADAPEPFVKSWDDRMAMIRGGGMQTIVSATIERWLVPSFRATHPDIVAQVEQMILGTAATGYIGCAEALKRLDYLADLPKIAVPTLFVVGAQDMGTSPEVMRLMAAAVKGSNLAIVPEAAHLSNLDNPLAFNAAIAEFLELR